MMIGALALLAGLWTAVPALAEPPRAARWIEADAPIYLEIPHPARLVDRVTDPSFQKALKALPPYAKAIESDGYATARMVIDHIADKLGTSWDKALKTITGGGIVAAVDAKSGTLIIAVTPEDPAFLRRTSDTILELARQDAADKGRPDPVETGEHRGITGYALDKGAFAIVEGTLVIVNKGETLKTIVDRALDGMKPGESIADVGAWKARREAAGPDAMAWGFVQLDRLRTLDPNKFTLDDMSKPQLTLLFGAWVQALKHADWVSAALKWTDDRLGAEVTLPTPKKGYGATFKGFVPPAGTGAKALASPPGTIANLSLWRDLAQVWEARADLFPPEVVQGLAKLDGFAGQFFGGRDFGSGVLGSLGDDWNLIVAGQDYQAMRPVPDQKLPAFALVAELKADDDDDFPQRLKVAFQSFIGLFNLGAAQSKAPPLELGSETFEGVTIATAKFMPAKSAPGEKEAVHRRHNFSPAAVQVGSHFVLSSSVGLARDLVKAVRSPSPTSPLEATFQVEADGLKLAQLLEANRDRIVMQNMLEKGHDKARAEEEFGVLLHVLRYLGHGRLAVRDGADSVRLGLDFALSK